MYAAFYAITPKVMRIGIFDHASHDHSGAQIRRHIAQQYLSVDLRRVGLAAAGGAHVAIFVGLAHLVDDDGDGAADLGVADARR
jgi:hypothetical protein